MSDRMDALAKRVEGDPDFLAWALAAYARAEDLDLAQLAARLGCLPSRLSAIQLCRLPREHAPYFQQDVERIAETFQIDRMVIAEAVRLATALATLRQTSGVGYLMAARDRDSIPDAEKENEP